MNTVDILKNTPESKRLAVCAALNISAEDAAKALAALAENEQQASEQQANEQQASEQQASEQQASEQQASEQQDDTWAAPASYQFGSVMVNLLEQSKPGYFKANIYPQGLRTVGYVQTTRMSVELLDAMKASFSAPVIPEKVKDDKNLEAKKKEASSKRKEMLLKVAKTFADTISDETVIHVGCRMVGVQNAFVWTRDGKNRILRYRLSKDGEVKKVEIVQETNPGYWSGKTTNDGRAVYFIQ